MTTNAYKVAHEALNALELYSRAYASAPQFQERKAEIVALLNHNATQQPEATQGRALLTGLAVAVAAM